MKRPTIEEQNRSIKQFAIDELNRSAKRCIDVSMNSRNLIWQATTAITYRDMEIAVMIHPKLLKCAAECRKEGLGRIADLLVRFADCMSDLAIEGARLEMDRLDSTG